MMNNKNLNSKFTKFLSFNERYVPQEPIIPHFPINYNFNQFYPSQTSYSQNFNEQKIPYKRSFSVKKQKNQDSANLKNKLYQLEKDNKLLIKDNTNLKEEYDILNNEYEKIAFARENLLNENINLNDRLTQLNEEFKRLEEIII